MDSSLSSIIVYLLAVLPAAGWILVYRYLDSKDPEPFNASSTALILGLLSTIPVFFLQYLFSEYPQLDLITIMQQSFENPLTYTAVFLIFVAVVEELAKAVAFIFVIRSFERSFNQVVDGIIYAAFIGVGFAFAENIYYFTRAIDTFQFSGNFFAVFSIRSFGTMLAHTLFTGLFGFYFAKAYFAPFITKESHKEKLWHNVRRNIRQAVRLHVTFFHLLPGRIKEPQSISRNALIFEGFIVAVLVHFLYNAMIKLELFGQNWTFLIVPLIFVSAWYVWSRFFVPLYTRVIDFVRTKRKGVYKVKVR